MKQSKVLCACYGEEPIVSSSVEEEWCEPAKPCSLETEEEGQEGEGRREGEGEREREAEPVLINNWSC